MTNAFAVPEWAIAGRPLPDGQVLFVPLTFGRARLTIGTGFMTWARGY